MYQTAKPLFMCCQTPLHAGRGDDLGVVDLPIQRERHTDFPKVEGSSLKGAFREAFATQNRSIKLFDESVQLEPGKSMNLVFGHPDRGDEHASAIGISDARLLLFPVKSLRGIFTWVSCPMVLSKFRRELQDVAQPSIGDFDDFDFETMTGQVSGSQLLINGGTTLVLEEFAIPATPSAEVTRLGEAFSNLLDLEVLPQKLAILSDESFRYFVKYTTEVITRIKIGEKGTVVAGPFNEEYLPEKTVLYTHITASRIFQEEKEQKGIFALTETDKTRGTTEAEKVAGYFKAGLPDIVQVGANATLAKGLLKTIKTHL